MTFFILIHFGKLLFHYIILIYKLYNGNISLPINGISVKFCNNLHNNILINGGYFNDKGVYCDPRLEPELAELIPYIYYGIMTILWIGILYYVGNKIYYGCGFDNPSTPNSNIANVPDQNNVIHCVHETFYSYLDFFLEGIKIFLHFCKTNLTPVTIFQYGNENIIMVLF